MERLDFIEEVVKIEFDYNCKTSEAIEKAQTLFNISDSELKEMFKDWKVKK